jgi:hypothetical protein
MKRCPAPRPGYRRSISELHSATQGSRAGSARKLARSLGHPTATTDKRPLDGQTVGRETPIPRSSRGWRSGAVCRDRSGALPGHCRWWSPAIWPTGAPTCAPCRTISSIATRDTPCITRVWLGDASKGYGSSGWAATSGEMARCLAARVPDKCAPLTTHGAAIFSCYLQRE